MPNYKLENSGLKLVLLTAYNMTVQLSMMIDTPALPVRIHVPFTVYDVINLDGQGQLSPCENIAYS